jgi:hypothetical protein
VNGLKGLIDILALPNMGDEGRKAKLVAIKAWQIEFLASLEDLLQGEKTNFDTASAMEDCDSKTILLVRSTARMQLINQILSDKTGGLKNKITRQTSTKRAPKT